jgi:hypothetical protein
MADDKGGTTYRNLAYQNRRSGPQVRRVEDLITHPGTSWDAGRFRSQRCCGSADEPSALVNVKFHQPFIPHLQQQGLAGFLVPDIGALHDLVDFKRLLAEGFQDILPIIQHQYSLYQTADNFE